jgi:hypothetical protein
MAQAGLHGLVGQAVKKWTPKAEWMMTGVIFGSLFPDTDNLAVAIATVLKQPTEGLHRTLTHSLFFVAAVFFTFVVIGSLTRKRGWVHFGGGMAVGITLHSLLDLLLWFNGVSLLWPLPYWINLWANVTPPKWFDTLMNPLEFLFIALFFYMLLTLAKKQKTDEGFLKTLNVWFIVELVLFVVFLVLLYTPLKLAFTIYGLLYLVSLFAALVITLKMRKTIEFKTA